MSKKRNYKKKGTNPCHPKPVDSLPDSDAHFSFIAGYTDSGVPFGLTWEEYNPYDVVLQKDDSLNSGTKC
jgi:hypothetical protein